MLKYAKSYVALLALIVASITTSDIVPVSGTAHKIWAVVVIIVGALATWAVPNATDEKEVK